MDRGSRTPIDRVEQDRCAGCGHPVSAHASFCERCGAALTRTDLGGSAVRAPDELAQKILGARSAIEGERKQITVMFTDIVGSMELGGSIDTERWRQMLDRFLAITSHAVHAVEGTVHQFTGDGVMALFGAPLAHEDHARRACLAALELETSIGPFAEELARDDEVEFQIRCGLNSGEVIVGSIGDDLQMEYASIGNTNGLAKRMESLAPPGWTALSASTAALVEGQFELRELGEFEIKGTSEPQRVFVLVGRGPAESRLEAAAARGLSRFVGRRAERAKLEAALEHSLAGDGRVAGIRGEPGVGKSRLVREFALACRARGLTINSANGVPHGRALPLLPVLAMMREFFGIGEREHPEEARSRIEGTLVGLDPLLERELPLLFDFLGVPDPERPLERIDPEARQRRLLAFVRAVVAARSRREPAVLVLEDLHWIDQASAAFLEALVGAVEGTRTLLVATFRPEYSAQWNEAAVYEELSLAPLDAAAAAELLEELLGSDPSLDGLAELIQERTAGNPFFIEEVVQALAEAGHLAGERGAYRLAGPLEELVLPPTVQAVLGARVDHLGAREKALVQTMSVIGREVPELILREVSELSEPELDDAVGALATAQFLTERTANGGRELEFKHPLTQEVAYTSQLTEPRARAHLAVAEAIERLYPDGLDERAALLAHHCEAAGELLQAAQWHARAATWAATSSPAEGMRHWRRVRKLTEELKQSAEAGGLAIAARISILALAWRLGISDEETATIHVEGEALTGGSEHTFERVLLDLAYASNLWLGAREQEGLELLQATSDRAFELGDPGLALTVAMPAGLATYGMGFLREGGELTERALELATDDVRAGAGLAFGCPYAGCLWVRAMCAGLMGRLDQAGRDFERSIELAREQGDLETEMYAFCSRASLRAYVLDVGGALRDGKRSVELAERSGNATGLVAVYGTLAQAGVHSQDLNRALEMAERALALARGRKLSVWEPPILAYLASAKVGLGEPAEALAAAEEAIAVAEARVPGGLGETTALLALAEVMICTKGADARESIEHALGRAMEVSHATGSLSLEPQIHAELAALARVSGDTQLAEREGAEAERIMLEIGAPPEALGPLRDLMAPSAAAGAASERRG
jgi:class 3 adenylate cyclase/tetratricopeptide (TPR) repeat protein